MKINLQRQIPPGVRDILPAEAEQKRKMENQLSQLFSSWGYQEVLTPTFEYYDVMEAGGLAQDENLYKFLDRQGKLLTLRPDMTGPIARLVATRMTEEAFPQRLCYFANAFTYAEPQMGRQREFFQAGVELIGLPPGQADGEVIAVAVEALKSVGLENFRIHVGQIDVFNGLMEELELAEDEQVLVKQAISAKNFVGLEELLNRLGCSQQQIDTVVQLTSLRGNKEVLAQALKLSANERAIRAIENLQAVFATLELYEVDPYVVVDFGVLRGFDYYTGLVFEGYSPELGYPICGGGRYDSLLNQFGFNCPATGFAIEFDRVHLALSKQGQLTTDQGLDCLILYTSDQFQTAILKARELRHQGYRVVTLEKNLTQVDYEQYLKDRKPQEVLEL